MTMTFGIRQPELPWGTASPDTPADITRILNEIAATGANSISMDCLWVQLDPNRTHKYQWGNLDYCINAAEAADLDILLNIEPRRSILPIGVTATPAMAADYGLLCGAIANRYAGRRIRWIEVGNEVNNIANFGAPKDPSKYLDFLRAAYLNIKPIMPDVTVLAGALMAVGTGWPSMAPVEWTQGLYDCKPQAFFDGLSMHPYMRDQSFGAMVPAPDNFSFKNIEAMRAIMDANGDSGKFIYTTEWGYDSMTSPSGLSTTAVQIEAEQAANVAAQWALLSAYADSGVIYPTTWVFMYRDWEQANKKAGNHYGMVHFDYVRKPEWDFIYSLAVDPHLIVTLATAVAAALPPTLELLVDINRPMPAAAAASAGAWAPEVITPTAASYSTASAQAWPPLVDMLSGVEWISTGPGARDTPAGTTPSSLAWDHTLTSVTGGLVLVPLVVSTSNLRDWSNYLPVVNSSLGGALVRLGSRHIGSSSILHGSVHIYGLYHPAPGLHHFTAVVDDAFTSFTSFMGNSIFLRGASGYGPVTAAGSSSGGNTPRITISSLLDHLALCVFGANANMTALNHTELYSNGATVSGDGDFIIIGDAPGATSVTFEDTTSGLRVFGALAIDVPSIVFPQVATSSPSVATATATAIAPAVARAGAIAVPVMTATAAALAPLAGATAAIPLVTASAAALAPIAGAAITVPAAMATSAQARAPIAGAAVTAPVVTAASAAALAPQVGQAVTTAVATATATALPPSVATSGGTSVNAPVATATAAGFAPQVGQDIAVPVTTVTAQGLAPLAGAAVTAVVAMSNAAAPTPIAGAAVTAPVTTATATAYAPAVGQAVTAPVATATATARAPVATLLVTLVQAVNTSTSSTRNLTANFSGYTPKLNDVVVLFARLGSSGQTMTVPSGWLSPLGGNTVVSGSLSPTVAAVYHLVTATEVSGGTTSYTATNLFDSAQTAGVIGAIYRNVDPNNVIDAANSTFNDTAVGTHVIPGLTGSQLLSNSMVVGLVGGGGTGLYTDPSGWALAAKNTAGQGSRAVYDSNTLTTTGVDVSSTNVTVSSSRYASMSFALAAAAA